MNHSRSRQILLSIGIISLMLSTALSCQGVNATSAGGMIEKSYTLTAGADGRAFAAVNGTWSAPAIQKVEYDHEFELYSIDYNDILPSSTTTYTPPGPTLQLPSGAYDPSWISPYPTGLGPWLSIPKFLMTHNTTNDVVSPTLTLSSRNNITLGVGVTTEIHVDAMNPVAATIVTSSAMVGTLYVVQGLVIGASVNMYVIDPLGNYVGPVALDPGYFAQPSMTYVAGTYAIYFTSTSSSYLKLTLNPISATSMAMGQFASGEIKVPEELTIDLMLVAEPEPSQIVALSYDVSQGDEYAFSFTMNEMLSGGMGPSDSDYICYYFDVGTTSIGVVRMGTLGSMGVPTSQPVVSKAVLSGKIYIVLVGNYISRFQYSMGVESAIVPTAPLDTPWLLQLPTPLGMGSQLYHFSIPAESMVKMNYTNYSGDTIYAAIYRVLPLGTVYSTASGAFGSGYFRSGTAVSSYDNTLYMSAGDYFVRFTCSGTSQASVEINTYPIANYTFGTAFDLTLGGTKALAFQMMNPFQYWAFNVTLLSHLNASMRYRMTLFDDYNRLVATYYADGNTARRGIGNKQVSGAWNGVTDGLYYVQPSGSYYFNGNKSAQKCQFISTYGGKYFLVIDFRYGYNTTAAGTSGDRWQEYPGLTASLKIDLSAPDLVGGFSPDVYEIKYPNLDITGGTASTSVTFTGTAGVTYRIIGLILSTIPNAWTRISVSILNGTPSEWEMLYDKIRWQGQNTFDYDETLGLWPPYDDVTNIYGYLNTTYNIEFCTMPPYQIPSMMVWFEIAVPAGAAHTVVSFTGKHFSTPGVSGLFPPAGVPPVIAAPFPLEIVLIVVAVVAVALVVGFVVIKKRAK